VAKTSAIFGGSHFGLTSYVFHRVLVSDIHKLLFVTNLNCNNVKEFLAENDLKKVQVRLLS
jgi:hypothetical protein